MFIRKIKGLWAALDQGEIVECFDTKTEAQDFLHQQLRRNFLKVLDEKRRWTSLWDVEHGYHH